MPPKGSSTALKPMRLPPLRSLKVRNPNSGEKNPCLAVMSSVLACWASNGFNVAGCANLESQLRLCMDTPRPNQKKNNNINYHLMRMYPKLVGPKKK